MLSWTREEKFNTPVFTSNHVLFCSLYEHKRLSLTRKVGFIHEWKNRINNSCRKLEGAVDKPYQTHAKLLYFFHMCCYGFSQGWKALYNTTVCIISEGGKEWGGGSLIPFHAWILKKYSCVTNTINCVSHVTDLEGKTSNYSSCVQCCRKIFRFSQNVRKHSQVMSSGGLMNVSS